jgi:hypothetical protein
MKNILVIISLFILAIACNQMRQSQKSKDIEIPKSAVVSADKMNVFYAGIDNPISVSVPGFKAEDVIVEISGGTIRQDTNGYNFNYIVNTSGNGMYRFSKITISVKVGDRTIPVETKEFRITKIPNPTPKFGSKASGLISKGEIKLVNHIALPLINFVYEGIYWRCKSFKLVFISKETGEEQTFSANSAELTNDMKTVLNNAVKGDKFIIIDINASTNIFPSSKTIENRKLNSTINLEVW